MTLVVDASVVAAALVDSTPRGTWARDCLRMNGLAAPHLMPAEVSNVLRRSERLGELSTDTAALAHSDLFDLSVELFAYEPQAGRVWQLRDNITPYDAWYVALAEYLDCSLATLDHRLSTAAGPTCTFIAPTP